MTDSTSTQVLTRGGGKRPDTIPVVRLPSSYAYVDPGCDGLMAPIFAVGARSREWDPFIRIDDMLTVTVATDAVPGDLVIVERGDELYAVHAGKDGAVPPGDVVLGIVQSLCRIVGPSDDTPAAFLVDTLPEVAR